jgi:hypothetical protein
MNQRMVELFEQAGISDSINEEFGIEYLAELIVRECAKVVFEKTGPKSALNVLEHFGVKE